MKQMDDNIGVGAEEAGRHGPARQHHHRLHDRQRRRGHHLPRRRQHALQGRQADHLGRRHARACVIRWPGHIKPGTVKKDIFASLDWLPTFVDIAGGPKGNELNKQIMAGKYPGHRQDQARRRQPARLSDRQVGEVGARHVLLLRRRRPVGGALQELEDLLHDGIRGRDRWPDCGVQTYHWTQVANIKRDPFESRVGDRQDRRWARAARSPAPSTAYIYDWKSCRSARCCG